MFLVNFPLTQTIEANSSLQFSHVFMEVWCWILEISHGFCHRSHHLLLIHRMNTTWLTYSPHLGHRPEPQWFSGCSKSLDDWQNQLEIHGFWLCLFGSLGSSGWSRCFFCVSNPFLATHISQRWILSASFSYDVTWFSWRISTKKSRVLFNIQWNSGDWTLEGTRRENPKDCRNITTFITTPFCFVWWRSCFFKAEAALFIHTKNAKTDKHGWTSHWREQMQVWPSANEANVWYRKI